MLIGALRRTDIRWGELVATALAGACGRAEPASTEARGHPGQPPAAVSQAGSREAAAIAAYEGPVIMGVPLYPDAREALDLERFMRRSWRAAGEPEELFEVRLGERIFETEAAFEGVRSFYLPVVHKVLMDHEMEFAGVGTQRMFTGLIMARDGGLVKLTITNPFFRYPDRLRVERTVLQMGRVGGIGP